MKKQYFLWFLAALLLPVGAAAQQTLTVGESTQLTNSNEYSFSCWCDEVSKTQIIYPAEMLDEMQGGSIEAITLYFEDELYHPVAGLTVKMMETDASSVPSYAFAEDGDAETLFTGTATSDEDGVMTITFADPFEYTGGNLMLIFETSGIGNYSCKSLYYTPVPGCYASGYSDEGWWEYSYDDDFLYMCTFTYTPSGEGPTCLRPGALQLSGLADTGVTVSWAASESGSAYVVSLGDSVVATVYDTFYVFDDLQAQTAYTVKVRTDCGDTVSSPRSRQFTTLCGTVGLPWTYGFEDDEYEGQPACWTITVPFFDEDWPEEVWPQIDEGEEYAHTGVQVLYFSTYDEDDFCMAASPLISNPSGASLEVSFWATVYTHAKLVAGVMTDPTDSSTFTPMLTVDNSNNDANLEMQEYTFYTTASDEGGNVCVAFKGYYTVDLDDVSVGVAMDCHRPSAPTVSGIGISTATLGWTGEEGDTYVLQLTNQTTGENTEYGDLDEDSLALSGLDAATTYSARVATICGGDTTMYTDFPLFTTDTSCYTVQGVTVDALTATAATISWTYSTSGNEHEGVQVSWRDMTDPDAEPQTETTEGTSITVTDLTANHLYRVSLRTLCGEGDTAPAARIDLMPVNPPCAEISNPAQAYNSQYYPICNYYKYGYSQSVYPATEIAGLDTIFGIAFYCVGDYYGAALGSPSTRTVNIYLTDTTAAALGSVLAPSHTTKVLDGGNITLQQPGWVNILFDTPYAYGGGNLVVTVEDYTGSYITNAYWRTHTATDGNCLYEYNDNHAYDLGGQLNPSNASNVPDLRVIGNCAAPTCEAPLPMVDATTTSTIDLHWTELGSSTSWVVAYRQQNASAWTEESAATDSHTIEGLQPGTTYTLRVGSMCDEGDTAFSSLLTATTATAPDTTTPPTPQPCDAPANVHTTSVDSTSATIDWTSDAASWKVSVNNGAETAASSHPHTLTGLAPSTQYTVRVKAVCADGQESGWATVSFTTTASGNGEQPSDTTGNDTTAIGTLAAGSFALYPNPATSVVTVDLGTATAATVAIIDQSGRTVRQTASEAQTLTLDVEGLAKGAYYVRLTTASGTAVRKLIVR